MARRLAAAAALLLAAGAVAGAVAIAVAAFPRGLLVLAFSALALLVGWHGLVRRGVARAIGIGAGTLLVLAAALLLVLQGPLLAEAAVVAALLAALACARTAFAIRAELPAATAPARPVLFWNPKSGDGKAARAQLAERARERGIEPIELQRGDDLASLARDAVARGAD